MTNVTLVIEEEVVVAVTEIHKNMTSHAIIRLQSKWMNILSPDTRIKKVLEIHRLLAEGKYEINKRLDVAIDRLLDGLFTKATTKPTDHQSIIQDEIEPNVPEDPNYWHEPSEFSENSKDQWL